MVSDVTRLLGLVGVEVASVGVDEDDNSMLALVTADEQAQRCPGCGVRSEHPHGWVRTRPRDLPVAGRGTNLTWTERRWKCSAAGLRSSYLLRVAASDPTEIQIDVQAPGVGR